MDLQCNLIFDCKKCVSGSNIYERLVAMDGSGVMNVQNVCQWWRDSGIRFHSNEQVESSCQKFSQNLYKDFYYRGI